MEWISVEEKMPPYNEPVLVVQLSHWGDETNYPMVTLQRRTHTDAFGEHWEKAEWRQVHHYPIGRIIAWMPLPEPPDWQNGIVDNGEMGGPRDESCPKRVDINEAKEAIGGKE